MKSPSKADFARITVAISPRTEEALARALDITSDSNTDIVNSAIRVYAYLMEIQSKGGSVIVRDAPDDTPERLRLI